MHNFSNLFDKILYIFSEKPTVHHQKHLNIHSDHANRRQQN